MKNYNFGSSYRYENEKGIIALISLVYPISFSSTGFYGIGIGCFYGINMGLFEIYCIEGNFFEDRERYSSFEEAEQRIYELLEEKYK